MPKIASRREILGYLGLSAVGLSTKTIAQAVPPQLMPPTTAGQNWTTSSSAAQTVANYVGSAIQALNGAAGTNAQYMLKNTTFNSDGSPYVGPTISASTGPNLPYIPAETPEIELEGFTPEDLPANLSDPKTFYNNIMWPIEAVD